MEVDVLDTRVGLAGQAGSVEFVSVLRVVEEVGEVRPEVEVVENEIRLETRRLLVAVPPADASRVPRALAAQVVVEVPESADPALADRAARDLVGRIPLGRGS